MCLLWAVLGKVYLSLVSFSLRAGLFAVQGVPAKRFIMRNKRSVATGPACPLTVMQARQNTLFLLHAGKGFPIVYFRTQKSNMHHTIIRTGQMGTCAAPGIRTRIGRQASTHRSEFNIAHRRQCMPVIHHKRRKTLRPKMPTPPFPKIHMARVAPVCFAQRTAQAHPHAPVPPPDAHDSASGNTPIASPDTAHRNSTTATDRCDNPHHGKRRATVGYHAV